MQSYEVVREVENLCANNQMRDIFFEEIETDDPVGWLRDFVKGKDVTLTVDEKESGDLTVFVESGGVTQKFLFTRLGHAPAEKRQKSQIKIDISVAHFLHIFMQFLQE